MSNNMAEMLSGRTITPGDQANHVRAKKSEQMFLDTIGKLYPNAVVVAQPRIFKNAGIWALIPDFAVTMNNQTTFFEVKRQADGGNAQERVYKYFVPRVMKMMKETVESVLGTTEEYPAVVVFCESLATKETYLRQFRQTLEPEVYLPWADYNEQLLKDFIDRLFHLL